MTAQKAPGTGGDGLDQVDNTVLAVKRIFVKDLSFEVPLGAAAFARQWQPKVGQDMATEVHKLADDRYEVVLKLTISVQEDDKVAYLAEIQQAGIFVIAGLDSKQLTQVLNTQCPAILFPYARELLDSLVVRGTFPALMLPPVNFEALFQQALARQGQPADDSKRPETLN